MGTRKKGVLKTVKLWSVIVIVTVLLCGAGCASIPFEKVSYKSVKGIDPIRVRDNFAHSLPSRFQVVDSIVFHYGTKSFAVIGYTDIDTSENTFKAVCLNPVGIKLLELEVRGEDLLHGYALEELKEHGDVIQAMAGDIRRIYFNRIPRPEAETCRKKYKIIFRQPFKTGSLEYVFAGAGNTLIEKNYFEGGDSVWSVFYYEYVQKEEKLYPGGIVFKHHQYDYKLVIRLKEICS